MHFNVQILKKLFLLVPFALVGLIAFNSYQYMSKKDGLFIDEIWTIKNANEVTYSSVVDVKTKIKLYFNRLNGEQEAVDKDGTGIVLNRSEELAKYYIPDGAKGFNYFNVIAKQTIHDSHPPLYHLIFHTVCSITHSDKFIKIGLVINLVILLLTCLFVQKITLKLTGNECISCIAMLFYGFSYGYLGNLVFIRMYTLMACLITILLYLFLCLNQRRSIEEGKRYLGLIAIVSLLSFLTHYYSILYVLLISIVELYQLKNDGTIRRYFVKYSLITICLFLFLWPQFFLHFYRGFIYNINIDSISFVSRVYRSICLLVRDLLSNSILSSSMLVVGMIILLYKNISMARWKNSVTGVLLSQNSILVIPSVVYFFTISFISPWVGERYVFPIFPILSIVVVLVVFKTVNMFTKNKWSAPLLVLAFCLFSSSLFGSCTLADMYERTDKKIEFLDLINDKTAIILGTENNWEYSEIVVNYEHPGYLVTNTIHAKDFLADKMMDKSYILYLSNFSKGENVKNLFYSLGYTCEKIEYGTDFHTVYVLERK